MGLRYNHQAVHAYYTITWQAYTSGIWILKFHHLNYEEIFGTKWQNIMIMVLLNGCIKFMWHMMKIVKLNWRKSPIELGFMYRFCIYCKFIQYSLKFQNTTALLWMSMEIPLAKRINFFMCIWTENKFRHAKQQNSFYLFYANLLFCKFWKTRIVDVICFDEA